MKREIWDIKHFIMQRISIVSHAPFESSPKISRKSKKLAKFHPIYTLSRIRVFLVSSSVHFVKYDKWRNLSCWIYAHSCNLEKKLYEM